MLRDAFIFQLKNTILSQVWMTWTAVPSSFVASFRDGRVEASVPWNLYSLHATLSLHGFAPATKMCPLDSKSDCYTESEYSTILPWCLLFIISAHANITKNVHEFHIYIIIFNHLLIQQTSINLIFPIFWFLSKVPASVHAYLWTNTYVTFILMLVLMK